jgi:hypothetical protein
LIRMGADARIPLLTIDSAAPYGALPRRFGGRVFLSTCRELARYPQAPMRTPGRRMGIRFLVFWSILFTLHVVCMGRMKKILPLFFSKSEDAKKKKVNRIIPVQPSLHAT